MKIQTELAQDARVCVLRVQGEIDAASAPELEAVLLGAIHRGCPNLVMDLAKVTYADSSALGLIVAINRELQPKDGRLVLAGASRNVARILELSGLVGAAPSVSSAADADDALAGLMLSEPDEPPLWQRTLALPATSESLSRMRSDVCDVLDPLEVPEAAQFDIRVAVGEALSNAIRHGSPRGEVDTVTIGVTAYSDRVVLVITDSGSGFDGRAAADGDPYAPSGRGVLFMRALMDHVDFVSQPGGGTSVTMVKHLGSASDGFRVPAAG